MIPMHMIASPPRNQTESMTETQPSTFRRYRIFTAMIQLPTSPVSAAMERPR